MPYLPGKSALALDCCFPTKKLVPILALQPTARKSFWNDLTGNYSFRIRNNNMNIQRELKQKNALLSTFQSQIVGEDRLASG